jgi:hypothetical protein
MKSSVAHTSAAHRLAFASVASVALALLVGCVGYTTHVPAAQAKKAPMSRVLALQEKQSSSGTIVVTRDSGSLGWMCYIGVTINTEFAGRFDIGETASFSVPPGDVLLGVGPDAAGPAGCKDGMTVQRESTIKSGETKYFRLTRTLETVDIQRVDR